jgi:hypothetical protein
MGRKILVAGLLGGLVMSVVAVVVNGLFGFASRLELKRVPNESIVYSVLKENVVEPGGYSCNPAAIPERGFPPNEPVFGIRVSGVGHEAAGRTMGLRLAVAFVSTTLAAWLLSRMSARVLAGYGGRLGFFVAIGLLIAVFADLPRHDIGGLPWTSAVAFAVFDVALWTTAGAVMAWTLRPGAGAAHGFQASLAAAESRTGER